VLEEKVRVLFTPGLVSYLENLDARSNWRIEAMDTTLIVYRLGKKTCPDLLRSFLDDTTSVACSFFDLAKVTVLNTELPS
jgi:hypothetical protein